LHEGCEERHAILAEVALVVYIGPLVFALMMQVVKIISRVFALLKNLQELTAVLGVFRQIDLSALIYVRAVGVLVDGPTQRTAKKAETMNYLKDVPVLR
jgi:hypothetical protein